jgi:hypothetical protein
MCAVLGRSIKSRGMRPYNKYKMVLSRCLRDEVKRAFGGPAADRRGDVGLARGFAHHPILYISKAVVRTCSTLDKQAAVTDERQEEENPDFDFILASTPFHETPCFGHMGMTQKSTPQISNHQGLFAALHPDGPCGSWGIPPDLGTRRARHS